MCGGGALCVVCESVTALEPSLDQLMAQVRSGGPGEGRHEGGGGA